MAREKTQDSRFSMNSSFSCSLSHRQYLKQESLDKKRREFDTNGWALLSKKSQVWTPQNSQKIWDFLGFPGPFFLRDSWGKKEATNPKSWERVFSTGMGSRGKKGLGGIWGRWEHKNPGILGPFQFFQQEISPEFPSDFAGISGVFGIALALGVWELRELGNVGKFGNVVP